LVGPLAPGLPRYLSLPQKIKGPCDFGDVGILDLLEYLGLSREDALGLCWQLFQAIPEWPKFEAIPMNPELPTVDSQRLRQTDIHELADCYCEPSFIFHARIHFCAPDGQIIAAFARWLRKQRAAMKLARWGHMKRDAKKLTRDLVVAVLSQDKKWALSQIETQLKFLGLPPITSKKNANGKIARRKTRCDIRCLVKDAKERSSLLRPRH
jgi:hypothetical protein